MKIAITIAYLLFLGFLGIQNERNPDADKKIKQEELLHQYYQLNLKIFSKDSDIKDVEKLFQMFSEDFTYVHEEYGGVYTREDLYNGYSRNIEKGDYDGSIYDIRVFSVISGKDALAVSKRYVSQTNPNPQQEDGEMAVFEFKDGKIFRITEYW
ncbi:nuclear transport factor 2 family protein [Algoriphagus sp. CAU 1675]|uniref:nuclear transport factor 2 family protein n=1 Tax=Algoriphagus sp. CAU 1675 TaxID=3032597 RepID=UPI0023DBAF32|nr:nuclear transport factor 2 family protein [Algoriphagus sp. CAU 1675]MDF2157106.1 nuclear transport factor 2 family protein [Algoriphagus sp. CAU 1675]